MKKINIYSEKFKSKKFFKTRYIYFALVLSVLFITIGYSAINKELNISGEAKVFLEFEDMMFTNCTFKSATNGGYEDYSCSLNANVFKSGVTLPNINSTVTYELTMTNFTNIDMLFLNIQKINFNNNDVEYVLTNLKAKDVLPGVTNKTFELTFKYKDGATPSSSIGSQLEFRFTRDTPIMVAGKSGSETSKYLDGPINRNTIESIEFLDNIVVPANAIDSFDASHKKNGTVIAWYTDDDSNGLFEFYIGGDGGVSANTTSYYLFANLTNLKTIDLTHLNAANIVSIHFMFTNCVMLEEVDLSNFDTGLVTNMTSMFNNTPKLTKINISNFNTVRVTTMASMFQGSGVKKIDFSSFETPVLNNMSSMFAQTKNLEEIIWGNFDTGNVTTLTSAFSQSEIAELDLSGFDTKNVTSTYGMFFSAKNLYDLNMSNWDTTSLTNMQNMFASSISIETIDLSGMEMASVVNLSHAFKSCTKLKIIDLRSANLTSLTTYGSIVTGSSAIQYIYVNQESYDYLMTTNIENAFKNKLEVV